VLDLGNTLEWYERRGTVESQRGILRHPPGLWVPVFEHRTPAFAARQDEPGTQTEHIVRAASMCMPAVVPEPVIRFTLDRAEPCRIWQQRRRLLRQRPGDPLPIVRRRDGEVSEGDDEKQRYKPRPDGGVVPS